MPQIFRSKMYSTAFPTAKFYALRADLYTSCLMQKLLQTRMQRKRAPKLPAKALGVLCD